MKKVGIITLNGNYNYGNRLQNYALQNVLEKIGGTPTTLVLEKNDMKQEHNFLLRLRKKLASLRHRKKFNDLKKIKKIKEVPFFNFTKNYIHTATYKYSSMDELNILDSEYDIFIVGSDQVWNPYFSSDIEIFFLKFANMKKRYSYAASFGINQIPSNLQALYIQGLSAMNSISVREEAGKKIVYKLTKRESEVVLDPTMLLSQKEWQKLLPVENKWSNGEPYVLVYFLEGAGKQSKEKIEEYAKKNNFKILVVLGDSYDVNGIVPDPLEFLKLISDAQFIFTDSFHANVFSIIFHKNFLTFKRGNMNSRIETLLESIELGKNIYVEHEELEEQVNKCINYKVADEILSKKRMESMKFLEKVIG